MEMPFGLWMGSRNCVLGRGLDHHMQRRNFSAKGHARVCPTTICDELYKNGLTNQDASWVVDLDGPKEACVTWGAHIAATWRIRLNRPCPTAIQPFCQITLITCYNVAPLEVWLLVQ